MIIQVIQKGSTEPKEKKTLQYPRRRTQGQQLRNRDLQLLLQRPPRQRLDPPHSYLTPKIRRWHSVAYFMENYLIVWISADPIFF